MFSKKAEMTVGLFMVGGIAALIYLSITLGNVTLFGSNYYSATAVFDSITGLREGATVEIAGVQVGKVTGIGLEDDMALVEMDILRKVKLSDDSIASIRTKGVIGEKFIKLSPGGSDEYIEDGGDIVDTESAISLEELISKYIFEK
ncbi:MAG: outer membrane lipid asymmetry maintenance protein MlaD [Deltaproteobacteria bacterium]|nr:outer membrane lipid asymmetry maintenance protein MlaD [Deltaproteobacteria bacterium]